MPSRSLPQNLRPAGPSASAGSNALASEPRATPAETNSKDAAEYIAQMTAELMGIAATSKLDLLAYFLDMARMEAETCARRDK